jgi:hypothetical protein
MERPTSLGRLCDACLAEQEAPTYPETMRCPLCDREEKVLGEGPVVNVRQDPTATYELECGHRAMA